LHLNWIIFWILKIQKQDVSKSSQGGQGPGQRLAQVGPD